MAITLISTTNPSPSCSPHWQYVILPITVDFTLGYLATLRSLTTLGSLATLGSLTRFAFRLWLRFFWGVVPAPPSAVTPSVIVPYGSAPAWPPDGDVVVVVVVVVIVAAIVVVVVVVIVAAIVVTTL